MAPRCFLHAADLHLDSPLLNLDLGDDEAARAVVRRATRDAFVRLVDHALARRAAFVVLAGDLWDGSWQDVRTGLWFVREVARLHAADIPLIFLRGNHDAESEATAVLPWPPHVQELPTAAAGTVRLAGCRVAVHGQGFAQRAVTANLALAYPPPVPGWLNVGVLHTALDGAEGHAPYAPCTVADLARCGYDYWALGHVHRHAIHARDPWIVYPGCLQGRHANETGPKGAVEVDFEGDRIVGLHRVVLDVVRWERPAVDVTGAPGLEAVEDRLCALLADLAAALDPAQQLLVVRPVLTGTTSFAADLLAGRRSLMARVAARTAVLQPRTVIETVEVRVSAPPSRPALADDAVADLGVRLAAIAGDAEMQEETRRLLVKLQSRLPAPVLERLAAGPLADALAGDLQGLLRSGRLTAEAVMAESGETDAAN